MNVYLLRHASAGTRRANPALDLRRPLDKEGKEQSLLMGRFLNSLRVQFDVIASSPLKRAIQTASLVGNEVGFENAILQTEALSPAASLRDFQHLLASFGLVENVLLVGHNPNLQEFLGSLVSTQKSARLRLRKGAVARIDLTRRPGTLNWLVDPRLVRTIYASVTKSSRRKISLK